MSRIFKGSKLNNEKQDFVVLQYPKQLTLKPRTMKKAQSLKKVNKKLYTLLTVTTASLNYQELPGCYACARMLTRPGYPHFDLRKIGNVQEASFNRLYKNNNYLQLNDLNIIKTFITSAKYDAINFIVPDPREITRNALGWLLILQAVPGHIRKNSYIIGYEKYFKVNDIVRSLAQISGASLTLSKLPKTNCPQADDTIDDFNDSIYTANNDFYYDGSVISESVRY